MKPIPSLVVLVRMLTLTALFALCVTASSAQRGRNDRDNSPHWLPIPIITEAARKAGIAPGGEGGQWPRDGVTISASDPNFMLLPIDVGGIYRTLDGGKRWEPCNVGWNARGGNSFAIDPRNSRHVLGVAGNSLTWDAKWGQTPHGVYRSDDQAASWHQVLGVLEGVAGALAFDPTSFDAAQKICTRVYFLSNSQGLFRSDDGGTTWRAAARNLVGRTSRDWRQGGDIISQVRVDKTATVWVGGGDGLWRSEDRGLTFTPILKEPITSVSLAPDGAVVLGTIGKILVAKAAPTSAGSFVPLAAKGLDTLGGKPVQNVAVSPADPRRILCWVAGDNWQWNRYISDDDGATFALCKLDNGNAALPANARQGYFAWHPTDPNIAFSLGGDWVTRSTDSGKTFHWWNNGNNGIMVGALFNLTPQNPDAVFLAFQDYAGATSIDGGKTWTWRDVGGKGWGGQDYGGYAVDGDVMWCGDSDDWSAPRRLRVSRDGGKTWANIPSADGKSLVFGGAEVSYSDPTNSATCFASNLRSTDKAKTWAPMPGCDGVYAFDSKIGTLYGKKGNAIVTSKDTGATWTTIVEVPGGFGDLALDPKTGRIYLASEDKLKVYDSGALTLIDTPRDQYGNSRVWTVAVDQQAPNVVYVGGPRNTYASAATVCRSTDSGKTWHNLTQTLPLGKNTSDSPHEVASIRVHPFTREAWVNGQCYGMWRIAPPAPGETGVSAEAASAPRAPGVVMAGSLVGAEQKAAK